MGSPAAEEVVFRSRLPDIEIPNNQTLQSYCFAKMGEVGSRSCLIDGETGWTYTYSEVEAMSRRTATGLRRMGVGKGDVIMNLLDNRIEFAISFLAAARLGAATATASPFGTHRDIRRQVEAAGVKLIVTEAIALDKVLEFAKDKSVSVVTTGGKFDGCVEFHELMSTEDMEADAEIHPEDVVALPYSSSGSGPPKGVMLTHRSLITSVAQLVDGENPNLYLRKEDVLLCLLPLFHLNTLNSVLLAGLRAGSAILITRKFHDTGMLLDQLRTHSITVAPLGSFTLEMIAANPRVSADDLASIRIVISDVGAMVKELQDFFRAKAPNAVLGQHGYGTTETGHVVAMCLAFAKEPLKVKPGSCGTVVRNTEMKIVEPDTGVSLGRNQSGEICIRGDQIMKGYLNDSEATKKIIDQDGWLHTRDIGFVDDNDEMFIVGRIKETIKRKVFSWHPEGVEGLLYNHPDIKDAAIVSATDDLAGAVPVAFVVRAKGSKITEDEIKNFIGNKVVFYKMIHSVFFVDSLPKTRVGKVLKPELRALARLAADILRGTVKANSKM